MSRMFEERWEATGPVEDHSREHQFSERIESETPKTTRRTRNQALVPPVWGKRRYKRKTNGTRSVSNNIEETS